MKEEYRTVLCEAVSELVEKRSRFIATVKPVRTEKEAAEFIEALKKKYWDARHNVYAYVIEENNIQRYSDDGEPAGTAGVPVLDIIKKEGLSNLVVVVTRYFGGILLGTGGLVHAYSKSAKMGVEAAKPICMRLCREILIECDYSALGRLQPWILAQGLKISDVNYADNVTFGVCVPVSDKKNFINELIDMTNGKINISEGEEGYSVTE